MPYQLAKILDSEGWVKLSGKLTVSDFQAVQTLATSILQRFGQICVLVELESFQGWSHEAAWGGTFLLPEDQNQISRLAFVGDEHWRDEIYMFTGKGMRKTAIEFFTPEQLPLAKAWLAEDKAQSLFLD